MDLEREPKKNRGAAYRHHIFKDKPALSVPIYPDAPAQFRKACFYTRPAVLTLAQELKSQVVDKQKTRVHLFGRSCGAGTALNCLRYLSDYKNNVPYFKDSGISAEDATQIMQAVNNGSVIVHVPLLGLHKARVVSRAGEALCLTTIPVGFFAGQFMGLSKPLAAAVGLLTYILAKPFIQKTYDEKLVPQMGRIVSNNHFDPYHPTPLESAAKLKGNISCPVLIHAYQHDGLLVDPDADTMKLYTNMRAGNDKVHMHISKTGSHNADSPEALDAMKDFIRKYQLIGA